MGGSYVVLVSVGPVQPFIAAARRTRDLWAGSWLLSHVAATLAKELADGHAENLVFPAVERLDELDRDDFPVANRVLAVVHGDAKAIAERAREKARGWLYTQATQTFLNLPVDHQLALAQVVELLEIQWVATPFEDDASWGAVRKRADRLLAGRKATHVFAHPQQRGDSGTNRKSSIDGLRESVVSRGRNERLGACRLARGEWLCGVSLLKRHVGEDKRRVIPSTSGLAALPTRERLEREHGPRYRVFCDEMAKLDDDEDSWLFEDRLVECVGAEAAPRARELLRDLFRETGVSPPSPYYALLRADGDGMGKLIASKKELQDHRDLSTSLVRFATEARAVVLNHHGHAVYTGGDDVLALLPVGQALDCATKLRALFGKTLPGETLSAGLVIAHHMDPLSDTVAKSVKAEHEAKVERDSLAVRIVKRSGDDTTVAGPWGSPETARAQGAQGGVGLDAWLLKLIQLLADDRIPAGTAHELRDAALRVKGAELRVDLKAAETGRILGRKQPHHGQEKALRDADRDALVARAKERGLLTLAHELLVARALAPDKEAP